MFPVSKERRVKRLLILSGFLAFFIIILNPQFSINNIQSKEEIEDFDESSKNFNPLKKQGYWDVNWIHIDNNWSLTEQNKPWCNGSGTWSDPYIIENVTVDGQNSGHCIIIENSDDYFIINNCTVYNSELASDYAGIKMNNTSNGTIRNSHIFNNYHGIFLYNGSANNTIIGNNVSFNGDGSIGFGIYLYDDCDNNTILNNIASNNDDHGIFLYTSCVFNNISHNTVKENGDIGMRINAQCHNNTISNNIIEYNQYETLSISFSNGIQITGNSIKFPQDPNRNGIVLFMCDFTKIIGNDISNNTGDGLYIQNCDDLLITENIVEGNDRGIDINSGSNINVFKNAIIDNNDNVLNLVPATNWNNSKVGNYWSDHISTDTDRNGICDTAYSINGGGTDYLPIYGNPVHNGSIIHIDDNNVSGDGTWIWASSRLWCSGSGTWSDPYIIEDLVINGQNSGSCILIGNSSVYFRIENCTVYNSSYGFLDYNAGIKLEYVNNGTIINNNASFNYGNGINLQYSNNITISGNYFYYNFYHGIFLVNSSTITVSGNIFNDVGIDLSGSLQNCLSYYIDTTNLVNGKPLYYYVNKSGLIPGNFSNPGYIILAYCNDSLISNFNNLYGINLYRSYNNTIINNSISQAIYGIYIHFSKNNTISGNNATNNYYGMYLYNADNNTVLGNNLSSNIAVGMYIHVFSMFNKILNNSIINNGIGGIWVFSGCNNNTISGNNASYNGGPWTAQGIVVLNSNNNTISDNILKGNSASGISLEDCSRNIILNNTLAYNELGGIWLEFCNNITLSENTMNENGLYVYGSLQNTTTYNIDTTNSVNGKPIYYYVNRSGLNPSNFTNPGQIVLAFCNDSLISNFNISHGDCGIYLYNCFNNTISNNNVSHNGFGLWLSYCYNNTISGNTACNSGRGIYLLDSNNNTVSGNTANNNNGGIYLIRSDNNTISGNNATNNYYGMYLYMSDINKISGNNASYNTNDGILLDYSDDNIIHENLISNNIMKGVFLRGGGGSSDINLFYNNTFIGNGFHVQDDGINNDWNNTFIGNYWDNYTGDDTNDDGIGDTSYIIAGLANAEDYLPIWDDGHNGSVIYIDDNAANNWVWAKTRTWCSGSGTWSDPYIIEDLVIDGEDSGSCIVIGNSSVYFRIENCTVYNSSLGIDNAGIQLENVDNGSLINNNASSNNGYGIYLRYCDNITISGNFISNNRFQGISLVNSTIITVSGNIVNDTGIGLSGSLQNCTSYFIDTTNLVNGKSVYYYVNKSGLIPSNFSNPGYIILAYCNNSLISNFNNLYGINLYRSYNNTIINNSITQTLYGLYIHFSNNNTISGNNATNNLCGMFLDNSNNNTISVNKVSNNSGTGIHLYYSDYNTFLGNNISFNGGAGMYIQGFSMYNEILNNSITHNTFNGIVVESSDCHNNTISGNNVSYNAIYGINIYYSHNNTISNNLVNGNEYGGIALTCCSLNIIFNNTAAYNNITHGIWLMSCYNLRVIDNNCSFNNASGIYLSFSCYNNTLSGNNASFNNINGIHLEGSYNNTISGNYASFNNENGIYLSMSSYNNTLSGNNASSNNANGIYLEDSYNNTISENNASYNNYFGIYFRFSDDNFVLGNNLSNNGDGIYIFYSNDVVVSGNVHFGNGIYLYGTLQNRLSYYIDTTNLVNGKPIYYYVNENGLIPSNFSNPGQIILAYCNDSLISNFNISHSGVGILLYYCHNNTISSNNVSQNKVGISLSSCNNNTISGNIANFNEAYGIYLSTCNNNTITGNYASFNGFHGICSILGNDNTISSNTLNNNNDSGIYLVFSNNNTVSGNTANNNNNNGIALYYSNNNTISENKDSFNNNGFSGIFLNNSHGNYVLGNVGSSNDYGIYLNQSNYNLIQNNIFLNNKIEWFYEEGICKGNRYVNNQHEISEADDDDGVISPENNLILILIIIVIGAVASAGGVLAFKNKSAKKEAVFKEEEPTYAKPEEIASVEEEVKPMPILLPKKKKKLPEGALPVVDITDEERSELEKTEKEVDVEEQKIICVVHKGPIVGANVYICPHCKSFYCGKCATALKEKGEKCWSCEREFDL